MTGTAGTTATDGSTPLRLALRAAAAQVRPVLLRLWRAVLLRRARDVTGSAGTRRLLVLAPHPDDETLGCGALVARTRDAGTRVRVLVVTDGRYSHRSEVIDADRLAALRREESLAACAELGVPAEDVVHLGLVEGQTLERLDEVVEAIVREVDELHPDDVLVTSSLDWHVDHRALATAAGRALLRRPGPRLLEYPVWGWADGPWSDRPGRGALRAGVDLLAEPVVTAWRLRPLTVRAEETHLRRKRSALHAYASQTTNLTGEQAWAVLDAGFLQQFLGPREVFFHRPEAGR